MGIIGDVYELLRDTYPTRAASRVRPADAACQQIVDPELFTDLLRRLVRIRELVGAVARYHS